MTENFLEIKLVIDELKIFYIMNILLKPNILLMKPILHKANSNWSITSNLRTWQNAATLSLATSTAKLMNFLPVK